MARLIVINEITEEEEAELRRRVRAWTRSKRDSLRAAIILRCTDGVRQMDVARELGANYNTTVAPGQRDGWRYLRC